MEGRVRKKRRRAGLRARAWVRRGVQAEPPGGWTDSPRKTWDLKGFLLQP